MAFLQSVANSIPGDPVYGVMVIGTLVYLLHAFIRGGRTNVAQKFRALKGDLTISFVIVVTTIIFAEYFMFIAEKRYFLLSNILSVLLAFIVARRVKKFYGLG